MVSTMRLMMIVSLLCIAIAVGCSAAQTQHKGKAHAFKGKVEAVNTGTKSLTVSHEKIDDWMDAMTMAYGVDNPDAVLKQVKKGDTITATVYDNDYTLYEVKVEPK
jgi:Cu/Ag efflux protein CusF